MNEADRPPTTAAAPASRAVSASTESRTTGAGRFAHYFVAKGWAHLMLLSGMGIFLFPFLWMFSTSLKTDDELPQAKVLPTIPAFRPVSPYIREIERPEKPGDVPTSRWDAMLPTLTQITEAKLKQVQQQYPGASWSANTVDAEAHRRMAARWLVDRLVSKMNLKLWQGADTDLLSQYNRLLDAPGQADINAALSQSLATLEMLSVQIRSLSTHIFTEGQQIKGTWSVQSGPARLVETAGARRVEYDFSGAATPVVLRYDLSVPPELDPKDLHKLTVAIKADDSWHRIDATLDWGDGRWDSQRTTFIAQHRAMSITFQPPTHDDLTNRARTWVPLLRSGPRLDGKTATEQATLRLTLTPSSSAAANVGKAGRNYLRAFRSVPFWKYVANSLILVALTMGGALFSASFVAYAFARLNWPGRSVAFVILLSTMMLPGQVTMIPGFMIWKHIGWYNTLNPMWVPAWFGGAFFIFLMTQHMKTIPRELEEAAKLDGLNAPQIWWYVMLPQVKPTLAAIAIMTFMGAWNEFMGPLVYLRDQDRFPLSLGLFGMRVDQGGDWTMIMAGNMLMTLPVIIIFFMFQRYFIQGMTMSGLKA
jgi:ABC-type glycerol-3-phosphate transport system permease component